MASVNVSSLLKHENTLKQYKEETDLPILALQEVWQHETQFHGQELVQKLRSKKRGGGVALLLKKNMTWKMCGELMRTDVEAIGADVE